MATSQTSWINRLGPFSYASRTEYIVDRYIPGACSNETMEAGQPTKRLPFYSERSPVEEKPVEEKKVVWKKYEKKPLPKPPSPQTPTNPTPISPNALPIEVSSRPQPAAILPVVATVSDNRLKPVATISRGTPPKVQNIRPYRQTPEKNEIVTGTGVIQDLKNDMAELKAKNQKLDNLIARYTEDVKRGRPWSLADVEKELETKRYNLMRQPGP